MALSLMEGNEAIARGAIAAGCSFFSGYPITPATTIYASMLRLLPPAGGVCLQGEDEIASMGYCIGASMAGRKVLTATSGPGISLCSEQISFAVASEVPMVIVDVQRLGPSTGSATRGADGDVQFLRWGNSGGVPMIVLAPVDVKDCFRLTIAAFNLSERFRCPVFIASNKEVSMTRESIDLCRLEIPKIIGRKLFTGKDNYLPYRANPETNVPDFLPMGGKTLVRQTSSTHGPDGYITNDSSVIAQTQQRLRRKLLDASESFSYHDLTEREGADTLVITYGVTARAAAAAIENPGHAAKPVSLLTLKTLWPVPEKVIVNAAKGYKRVVVAEMNLGQYVREIRRILAPQAIDFLGQMDGQLITPEKITEVVENG